MNEETRKKVFSKGGFFCSVCGRPVKAAGTPQIAHKIKSGVGTENHIMSYIWNNYHKDRGRKFVQDHVINHELNLSPVCSLKCNDACNIFFDPVSRDALIDEILTKSQALSL